MPRSPKHLFSHAKTFIRFSNYPHVARFGLAIAYSGYLKYLRNIFQMLLKVYLLYIKFYLLCTLDCLCGCVKQRNVIRTLYAEYTVQGFRNHSSKRVIVIKKQNTDHTSIIT